MDHLYCHPCLCRRLSILRPARVRIDGTKQVSCCHCPLLCLGADICQLREYGGSMLAGQQRDLTRRPLTQMIFRRTSSGRSPYMYRTSAAWSATMLTTRWVLCESQFRLQRFGTRRLPDYATADVSSDLVSFASKATSEHPPVTQSLASHEGCSPLRTSWLSSSHGRRHPILCKTCKDPSVLLSLRHSCEAVSTVALVEYYPLPDLSLR